ncbi:tldc domain-containing protein [Stylonychia lemnae]|uniref:Tldc domain-containing protein n=1 Tax=Stylonychia lemnae TaxID=5949 RepID=A0A077ZYZ7_STYLE|nr:tldc domain-containing protein [Stylonychia lemnae]|eukprot:CDW75181.1 tldc domain-containing protein [Stylonychia lemnae]
MESDYRCAKCNERFNTIDKQQLILPCGDSICLSCFEPLLLPQESKLVCPVDQEIIIIPKKFKENVQKMLKTKNNMLWILCQDHVDIIAEYYCNTHRQMICHQCAYKTHADHAKKLDHVVTNDIQGFCERALHRLQERKNKLSELISEVEELNLKEKSSTSDSFIKIFRDVQDQLIPHMDKAQIREVQLKFKEKGDADFNEDTLAVFNITNEHELLLKQWIHGEEKAEDTKFELLYKATRDTFSAQKMHELIDDKGPIVGLIKSQHDQVFGGYCSLGWKSAGAFVEDDKAFIFSLTKKTKHELSQNKNQAVYYDNGFMLWFGYDILLYNDCNANASSYSNFGNSYQLPDGMAIGSEEANNYIAGSHYFTVSEIEIFKVTLPE